MEFLFAILTLLFGLTLTFGGYMLARIAIPIWGFVGGVTLGAAITAWMTATPFLATVLGVIFGVVLGLIFAVLAYLYFAIAIVVLIGSVGYWAGSSFIMLMGLERGFISTVAGLALGIIVALVCLMANAPKYVLIGWTAVAGSITVIGSLLLMFNIITFDAFYYGATGTIIADSFIWLILAILLTFIGVFAQLATTEDQRLEQWGYDEEYDEHHLTKKKPSNPSKPQPVH